MFKTVGSVLKYDEEKLWTAVVEQAIREATGKNKELKEAAYSWIHSKKSFETVCELANLDYRSLKNMLNRIIGKKKEDFMDLSSQKAFLIDNIKECVTYLLPLGEFCQDRFYIGNLGKDKIIVEIKGENAGNWHDLYREKKGNILSLWSLVQGTISCTQSVKQWCTEQLQKQQNITVSKTSFSVDQYLNDQSPMPKDIIGPRILTQGGLLVIGGTPKVGKSSFLLTLLSHMAAGASFLNMKSARPLKIFYLQNEMEYGDVKERLLQTKIDHKLLDLVKENLFITKKIQLTLNPEEMKAMIAEKCDVKTVDLIVIDSFLDHKDMFSFIRNGMNKLRLITNPMAGIIITHYTKKVSPATLEKNPFQALSGSNILRSAYTSGIMMFKPDERKSTLKVIYESRNSKPVTKYIRKVNGCWKTSKIVSVA